MEPFKERPRRFPRTQRFQLTPRGADAESTYRSQTSAARADAAGGRAAFEAVRAAWASALKVEPDDALCLLELREAPRRMDEMAKALEDCGATRDSVKAAVQRLLSAGLVEPSPGADLHNL